MLDLTDAGPCVVSQAGRLWFRDGYGPPAPTNHGTAGVPPAKAHRAFLSLREA